MEDLMIDLNYLKLPVFVVVLLIVLALSQILA